MLRPIDQHRGKLTRFLPFTGGLLSRRADWIQASVEEFRPQENAVVTSDGQQAHHPTALDPDATVGRWYAARTVCP